MVEFVLAGCHVVLPAVPRAAELLSLEPALAERPAQVEAVLLGGEELAINVRDRNLLFVDREGPDRPGRDVLYAADIPELGLCHLDERNKAVKKGFGLAIENVNLGGWRRSCWRESTSSFAASSRDFFLATTSSRSIASTRPISCSRISPGSIPTRSP